MIQDKPKGIETKNMKSAFKGEVNIEKEVNLPESSKKMPRFEQIDSCPPVMKNRFEGAISPYQTSKPKSEFVKSPVKGQSSGSCESEESEEEAKPQLKIIVSGDLEDITTDKDISISKKMGSSQPESQLAEINVIEPVEADSNQPIAQVVESPMAKQVAPKSPLTRSKTDFKIIPFVVKRPENSPRQVSSQ